MKKMSQKDMFYKASRDNAALDAEFSEMVNGPNPITKAELERLIQKRPTLWGRWKSWLDKLQ
jgi:hypothetical protein